MKMTVHVYDNSNDYDYVIHTDERIHNTGLLYLGIKKKECLTISDCLCVLFILFNLHSGVNELYSAYNQYPKKWLQRALGNTTTLCSNLEYSLSPQHG